MVPGRKTRPGSVPVIASEPPKPKLHLPLGPVLYRPCRLSALMGTCVRSGQHWATRSPIHPLCCQGGVGSRQQPSLTSPRPPPGHAYTHAFADPRVVTMCMTRCGSTRQSSCSMGTMHMRLSLLRHGCPAYTRPPALRLASSTTKPGFCRQPS